MAGLFGGLSEATLQAIYSAMWWLHLLILYYFANELPYSKHFHVYTSLFNVFFANLDPPGKLPTMDLENIDEDTRFGVSTVTDFTWKQMLDLYTCTECGRCREFCPDDDDRQASTAGSLSPRAFETSCTASRRTCSPTRGERASRPTIELVPAIVDPEVVWACTTCRWCERACPLDISYVDKMVDQRRNLVLEKAEFPEEAQAAFRGYEVNGNPVAAAGRRAGRLGRWSERAAGGGGRRRLRLPVLCRVSGELRRPRQKGLSVVRQDPQGGRSVKLAILGPEELSHR